MPPDHAAAFLVRLGRHALDKSGDMSHGAARWATTRPEGRATK